MFMPLFMFYTSDCIVIFSFETYTILLRVQGFIVFSILYFNRINHKCINVFNAGKKIAISVQSH